MKIFLRKLFYLKLFVIIFSFKTYNITLELEQNSMHLDPQHCLLSIAGSYEFGAAKVRERIRLW